MAVMKIKGAAEEEAGVSSDCYSLEFSTPP